MMKLHAPVRGSICHYKPFCSILNHLKDKSNNKREYFIGNICAERFYMGLMNDLLKPAPLKGSRDETEHSLVKEIFNFTSDYHFQYSSGN